MKDYEGSQVAAACCSCGTLRRKWPHLLVACSLLGLVLFGLFKWVALDWLVEQQIAQVKIKVFSCFLTRFWSRCVYPYLVRIRILYEYTISYTISVSLTPVNILLTFCTPRARPFVRYSSHGKKNMYS
jgi:NADH:ubiquinone oxidoreductase subunit H